MGADSTVFGDEFDVYERNYVVETKQEAKRVAERLCDEFDKVEALLTGDGEYDGWMANANATMRLGAYLHGEWKLVEAVIEDASELVYGEIDTSPVDERRVEKAFKRAYDGCHPDHPESQAWDSHPYGGSLTRPKLEQIEAETVGIEDKIRTRVLMEWHPRDFGIDPDDQYTEVNVIDKQTAIQRTAELFDERWHYVYPERDVRSWQTTLYVYDEDLGIYRPRGETHVKQEAERLLGQYATNNIINELVSEHSV